MPVSSTPPGAAQDDDLVFADETPAAAPRRGNGAWRVLIVDDDPDVHSTTTFALGNLEMHGLPLEFLHAYSAAQAMALLEREHDIAVILLDVVMEQADAGLHLVRHVRDTLGRHDVRIILRTGQPGYAPEMDAIRGYDINDYRTKSELTRTKLYTSVAAAIRAYQQTHALEQSRTGLAEVVRANTELMALHSAGALTMGILREVAALAGQPADGLLCACPPGHAAGGWQVLASCGPSAGLVRDGVLAAAADGPAAAIALALAERRSLVRDDHLALYFRGNAHCDFAAWMRLTHPLDGLRRGLIDVFTSSIAVGLDNVALMTDLQRAAFHDPLTSLPNRTRLVELVADSLQNRADATLCLVDIDQFAETNDALGHHFGDALLGAVAQRLRVRLDARLALARIGGDIFALLGEAKMIDPAALQDLFTAPFSIDGQDVQVSATLGLVRLQEHDGNVSQVQFRHPHFIDMLRQALADTGAPPERIELEITESMAMEEPDLLIERLAEIKRTGVSIAIDDFGTGFSSLSYLQRLRVDRLKIDRAFVTEITDAARGSSIARMVIELARNLGLSIIAEGVEDERQAQILQTLGCPLAQGYLFSRPLAADALVEWLGNGELTHAA